MRVRLAALCLLLAWHPALAQDATDPYSVATMRSLLASGNYLGALEKQNERLGDRAAIAALKIFDEAELTRPENVRKLLPILHESFAYRQLISIPEDRKPSVTLFLLHYLERNVSDPAPKKEAAAVEASIKTQTAKPRNAFPSKGHFSDTILFRTGTHGVTSCSRQPGKLRAAIIPMAAIVAIARTRTAHTSIPLDQLGPSLQGTLVKLWITALDSKGDPVLDLSEGDLRLYEDNVERQVVGLARRGSEPLTVGLLVDAAWKHRLPFFRPKLTGSAALLQPFVNSEGAAFVAAFADRVSVGKPTADPNIFEDSVRRAAAAWLGTKTALFDAVDDLCRSRLALLEGQKALVVVSDADDTASKNRIGDAVRSAELSETQVFVLVTVHEMMERFIDHQPWMQDARDAALRLSSETGGMTFRVHTEAEVDRALEQTARCLGSEYAIAFQPAAPGFHKIRIRSLRRGVKILYQREYRAPQK